MCANRRVTVLNVFIFTVLNAVYNACALSVLCAMTKSMAMQMNLFVTNRIEQQRERQICCLYENNHVQWHFLYVICVSACTGQGERTSLINVHCHCYCSLNQIKCIYNQFRLQTNDMTLHGMVIFLFPWIWEMHKSPI